MYELGGVLFGIAATLVLTLGDQLYAKCCSEKTKSNEGKQLDGALISDSDKK